MGIEATTTSTAASSTSSASQVSGSQSAENAKKTSGDSSFKDEMSKVSKSDSKKEEKEVEKTEVVSDKKEQETVDIVENFDKDSENVYQTLNGTIDYSKFGSMAVNDANTMLTNDIMQMMNTSNVAAVSEITAQESIFAFGESDGVNRISMTENDAQFFINLTQNEDVSMQNITAQAQNLLNSGAEIPQVKQNVQISQTLLNALSKARENNQPLRIDFDQNVSVILRIGKDGALAANFIPGDKAVEQYLRNNIETLKATFRENELPYSDLSYSNSSKQQNQRRRNQQQGEQ